MNGELFTERRRFPRAAVHTGEVDFSLAMATTVQVLDISESGVLLASTHRLDVGRRAQLRTRIGPDPLMVQVEIKRVATGGRAGHGHFRLGAEFVALDEENRRRIARFLRNEN